eukprot:4703595-Prymnesium_polylepis.1
MPTRSTCSVLHTSINKDSVGQSPGGFVFLKLSLSLPACHSSRQEGALDSPSDRHRRRRRRRVPTEINLGMSSHLPRRVLWIEIPTRKLGSTDRTEH